MGRKALKASLPVEDFRTFYWLKAELVAFCRKTGLPAAGSKREIAARIERYLRTGEIPRVRKAARRARSPIPAPTHLTLETRIGPGWTCNQALRAFFTKEAGPRFHFNGAMRDFIRTGKGRTLGEAIKAWEESRRAPKGSSPIAPQFEFNRHIRAYFKAHPGKTHADAVKAWKDAKAKRGTGRRSNA